MFFFLLLVQFMGVATSFVTVSSCVILVTTFSAELEFRSTRFFGVLNCKAVGTQ